MNRAVSEILIQRLCHCHSTSNSGKCHSIGMRSEKSVCSARGAAVLQFLAFSSMQPGCLLHFQKYSLVTWCQKISLTLFMCATAKNSAVQPSRSLHYVRNMKSQTPALTEWMDWSHHQNRRGNSSPGEELRFNLRFVLKVSCCCDRQARVKALGSVEACRAYN